MPYTDPDILSDETALAEQFLDLLADQIDGWEPHDGQIEPPLAESYAVIAGATNAMLKDAARADYIGWGKTVLGIDTLAAVTASGFVSVTMVDNTGHLMPAGSQLLGTRADGERVPLITLENAETMTGQTTITPIAVAAMDPGADGNTISGDLTTIDAYAFVDTVTLLAPTAGGRDAEDADAYLTRLRQRARRQHAVPATVADYAEFALDVEGVARCLAINLLDTANPGAIGTAASEGHLTLVPIDVDGGAVPSGTAAALVASFTQSDRPLQIVLHTMSPTVTAFPVTFKATVKSGLDSAAVITAAAAAVDAYLAPATWGYDEDAAGRWKTRTSVYYADVAALIKNTEGIDVVTELKIDDVEDDLLLSGLAPLPNATVTGTLA